MVQARCKVKAGFGGSGVVWCRPGVRFKEVSGGLAQARCTVQGRLRRFQVVQARCKVQGRFRRFGVDW